jgi:hypothetical protein
MLLEIPESLTDQLWELAPKTLSPEVQLVVPQDEWVRATAVLLLSRAVAEHVRVAQETRRGRGENKRHLIDPHRDAVVSEIINNLADTKQATMGQIQDWALDAICRASPDSTCPVPSDYREKWVARLVVELRAAEILTLRGSRSGSTYELHTAKRPAPAVDNEIPF